MNYFFSWLTTSTSYQVICMYKNKIFLMYSLIIKVALCCAACNFNLQDKHFNVRDNTIQFCSEETTTQNTILNNRFKQFGY